MDIDQASTFLVGSILLGIGCIILAATATVINNIFSRYWRPVNFTRVLPEVLTANTSARFASPEELSRIAPEFDRAPLDLSKSK
jgi:hypothetical protein